MKKLVIVALALLAVTAWGQDVQYRWNIGWCISAAYSPTGTDNGVLEDYDVTWSLIFGSGDTYSWSTLNGQSGYNDSANGGSNMSYDEWLQADTSTLFNGPLTTEKLSDTVFQRIELFNPTSHEKEWYWEGTVTPVEQVQVGGSVLTPADIGKDEVIASAIGVNDATAAWSKATSVPEPATMSLLGLGALAMVLRRKLRK